jgi:hypothetical protein
MRSTAEHTSTSHHLRAAQSKQPEELGVQRLGDLLLEREVAHGQHEGHTHHATHHAVPVLPEVDVLEVLQSHALALLPLGELLVTVELHLPSFASLRREGSLMRDITSGNR